MAVDTGAAAGASLQNDAPLPDVAILGLRERLRWPTAWRNPAPLSIRR
ncbi:MAG: hypothetical protein IPO15_13540 [Anaerolineae bacterium]|nr:hypothetical protein [Anaerolineae bacterium]